MNVHYLDKAAFMDGNADEGEEAMVFDTSPSYDDIVVKVRNVLNWINPSDGVKLIGRYDVGVGVRSRLKSMPITSQLHWDVYKEKVEGSQDKSLELFATRQVKVEVPRPLLDLNRNVSSPIHDDVVVYDHNAASQPPSSQPNEEDINARAIVLVGDDHVEDEAVAHVDEHANVHVDEDAIAHVDGDAIAQDDVYAEEEEIHYNPIGDLDVIVHQQDMDRNLPYSRMCRYKSNDEGPPEELDEDGFTPQENQIYKKVNGKERGPSLFRDLSLADKAVVDGGMRLGLIEPSPCPRMGDPRPPGEDENAHLKKGIKFGCLQEFKIWLSDYAIRNHRSFVVGHSNKKLRYTIKCDKEACPWKVRGRKIKETGQWELKSCVATHKCIPPEKADRSKGHRQLTSEYLGYKLLNEISHDPTVKVKFLMSSVFERFGYPVKYGKAWMAKANAIRMLHGDYVAAYNILPRMLGAIAHRNPGMRHRVESIEGVFHRAFWSFGQCIDAFRHCRPVLSIDGTFLTGKYKGTLMVAMAHSSNDNVLPVAFALVPSEHDDNWQWFMDHVRTKVIGPKREVCIITDRHHGILKAI